MQTRELDLVLTLAHRPEREVFAAFTGIYLPTPLVIMRRRGDANIADEHSLNGRVVALMEAYSSSERVLGACPRID